MIDYLKKYQPYQKDIDFILRYMKANNAANGSEVDANSNVSSKNIATMAPEIHKKDNVYANRLFMHHRITEMYGEELADEYIRQLEEHELYRNDETLPIGTPYCASITMYPFITNGMKELGGTSVAPKHLDSFLGGFANLVFAVSAELCGACATPEFIAYTDHFIRKEYGDDYYLHTDKVINQYTGETLAQRIGRGFEQVVYSLNQPAAARGFQSVFWNVAYFDEPYFKSLFDGFAFPDGDEMKWESVKWLQKYFMNWFNEERRRNVLTFPVESLSLLNDGEDCVDKDMADFAAEMYSKGHSFFTYSSDSVDSLASCCFKGDTPVLAKSSNGVFLNIPIKELHDIKWKDKKNLTVFHNGSWVLAKTIKLPGRQMFSITTSNKKNVVATDNHLWPTLDGLKHTSELTENDWLMFNTRRLDAIPERDRHLTYEQGFLIGMYLGDGSIEVKEEKYKTVHLSLNKEKYVDNVDTLNKALDQCGIENEIRLHEPYNNVFPVTVYGTDLPDFIEEYVVNGYANEKRIKPEVFAQSAVFRLGILYGLYATDGGNSNRIYTTSEGLAHDIETICTTLGLATILDVTDRTSEPVVIRGETYNRNYPLWCVRWYDSKNKRTMGDVYKVVNNSMYFKITNIEEVEPEENVYCFECKNDEEPYFTLPNGIITHNCRLRNGITDNTFSYTLGAGGVATGSKCVMTMNINRLVQKTVRDKTITLDEALVLIRETIAEQTEKMHKYLLAFDSILMDMYHNHMIPIYDAGFVSPEKQYLTLGINGFIEAAEYLGIDISDNAKYRAFCDAVLSPIYELNKRDKTEKIMFNSEFIPAENLGIKNSKWDKEDGLFVPRDCYNSYFYKVEDPTTNVLDKFRLHGKHYTGKLDGGSALHCNLEEHLSKDQYRYLLKVAVKEGTPYFTFNVPNTICNDCGHISKHKLNSCPACGSENLDYATRIIGYLTRVSKWSLGRQQEHERRYYSKGIGASSDA